MNALTFLEKMDLLRRADAILWSVRISDVTVLRPVTIQNVRSGFANARELIDRVASRT